MSNEKPAELTEAERDALMYHIGSWKFTARQSLASAEDAFMRDVAAIVAAREAAARREALLAFADTRGVNVGDEDSEWWQGYRQAQRECLRDATDAALAEPERDEEGGR